MISNRNIINLILEIKKSFAPYHCLIDSLFLSERFYNVKKTQKNQINQKKQIQKNRPTLVDPLPHNLTMDMGVAYIHMEYMKHWYGYATSVKG